jgi:NTE family protein
MPLFRRHAPPPLSLALQGGGAHGAFTWGVLDALLERGVDVAAISGASAGAMNAVVMASGLAQSTGRRGTGQADAARAQLASFWQAVAHTSSPLWHVAGDPPGLTAAAHTLLLWSQFFTPTQLNPLGLNPLRDVLAAQIDFERLRATPGPALFVAATDVQRGCLRLFRRAEMTLDALMASACLPSVAKAVQVDGRAYWDGAFTANPALWPLVREVTAADLLIITLSPLRDSALPDSAAQIQARATDIAFDAAFLREARWLGDAQADARQHWWALPGLDRRLAQLRCHLISGDAALADLPRHTKLVPEWGFLQQLRDFGRDQVSSWWAKSGTGLGRRSTVDLQSVFGEAAVP